MGTQTDYGELQHPEQGYATQGLGSGASNYRAFQNPPSPAAPEEGNVPEPSSSKGAAPRLPPKDVPLDPGPRGYGRSIPQEELEAADIVLSTTPKLPSKAIRSVTESPVSHAILYVGDGMVTEAILEGVVHRLLSEAIADATLAVVLRYQDLTDEQAFNICEYANAQEGKKYDGWGIVRQGGFRLDEKCYCRNRRGDDYRRCREWVGKVNLGTKKGDSWFCSELVLTSFQFAGVPLTTEPASWNSPADIATLMYSGKLGYVGHLRCPTS